MASLIRTLPPWIEYGLDGWPLDGAEPSGDCEILAPFDGGVVFGVADGLGHGPEAAEAARRAAQTCRDNAERPIAELFDLCHEALRYTRGAVISVASLNHRGGCIEWAGIGNAEGVLYRGGRRPDHDSLTLRGGVVGYRYPKLRSVSVPIRKGDVVIFATDGIGSAFLEVEPGDLQAQELASLILTRYGKRTDDALVLAVRYHGDGS